VWSAAFLLSRHAKEEGSSARSIFRSLPPSSGKVEKRDGQYARTHARTHARTNARGACGAKISRAWRGVRGGAEKVRVRPRCGVPRLSLFRRVRQETTPGHAATSPLRSSRRCVSPSCAFVCVLLPVSYGAADPAERARPKRQERPRASRRPTSGIRRNEEGTAMMPRSHLRTRRRSTSMHRTCTCQHGAARR